MHLGGGHRDSSRVAGRGGRGRLRASAARRSRARRNRKSRGGSPSVWRTSCARGAARSSSARPRSCRGGQYFGGRSVPMGAVASVAVRPDQRGLGIAPRLLARSVETDARAESRDQHAAPGDDALLPRARLGDRRRVRCATRPDRVAGGVADRRTRMRPSRPGRRLRQRARSATAGSRPRSMAPSTAATRAGTRSRRRSTIRTVTVYVYDGDGQIDGYVVYDQRSTGRQWGFGITVHELVAADARAAVTLWRHLGSHAAQVDTVTVLAMPLDVADAAPSRAGRRARRREPLDDAHRRRRRRDRRRAATRPGSAPRCTSSSPTGSRRGTTVASCSGSRAARGS